jgi:hypothetical protein
MAAAPQDIYDGEPWSEMDIEDLRRALKLGVQFKTKV